MLLDSRARADTDLVPIASTRPCRHCTAIVGSPGALFTTSFGPVSTAAARAAVASILDPSHPDPTVFDPSECVCYLCVQPLCITDYVLHDELYILTMLGQQPPCPLHYSGRCDYQLLPCIGLLFGSPAPAACHLRGDCRYYHWTVCIWYANVLQCENKSDD